MRSTETVNPVNESAVDSAKVREIAEKSLQFTASRHNATRDQLRQEVIDAAYREASEKVVHERELAEDPGYQALLQERQKVRQLEVQLEALKQVQPVRNESGNAGHARSSKLPDSEMVRARMGEASWWSLTQEGRLLACGIAPDEITAAVREQASEVFGRKANSQRANDLYRSQPDKYRRLKTIASVLNLSGK
jgi:hypothetical protein